MWTRPFDSAYTHRIFRIMEGKMVIFVFIALVLGSPLAYPGEKALLLFDREGGPRCHISGKYKDYLASERIEGFVREGALTEDLRECGQEDALYAGLVLGLEDIQMAGPSPEVSMAVAVAIPLFASLVLAAHAHKTGLAWPWRTTVGLITGTNAAASCFGGKLDAENISEENHLKAPAFGSWSGFYATTLRYVEMPKSLGPVASKALKDQAINLAASLVSYRSCRHLFADDEKPQEDEEVSGTFILYGEDGEGPDYIEP